MNNVTMNSLNKQNYYADKLNVKLGCRGGRRCYNDRRLSLSPVLASSCFCRGKSVQRIQQLYKLIRRYFYGNFATDYGHESNCA